MATWTVENFLFVGPSGGWRACLVKGHAAAACTSSTSQQHSSSAAQRAQEARFSNLAKMHILIYSRNSNWPQANNNCMRIFHLAPSPLTPFREKTAALRSEGEGKLNKKHIEGTAIEWERRHASQSQPPNSQLWSASETISLCLLLCKQ